MKRKRKTENENLTPVAVLRTFRKRLTRMIKRAVMDFEEAKEDYGENSVGVTWAKCKFESLEGVLAMFDDLETEMDEEEDE